MSMPKSCFMDYLHAKDDAYRNFLTCGNALPKIMLPPPTVQQDFGFVETKLSRFMVNVCGKKVLWEYIDWSIPQINDQFLLHLLWAQLYFLLPVPFAL